jgi:hypothetical protein
MGGFNPMMGQQFFTPFSGQMMGSQAQGGMGMAGMGMGMGDMMGGGMMGMGGGKPGELPEVPSVTSLWPAADWHEREVYDLSGVFFTGAPG